MRVMSTNVLPTPFSPQNSKKTQSPLSQILQNHFAQRTDTISPKMQAQLDKLAEAKKVEEAKTDIEFDADLPETFGLNMGLLGLIQGAYTGMVSKHVKAYEETMEDIAEVEQTIAWKQEHDGQDPNAPQIIDLMARKQATSSNQQAIVVAQEEVAVKPEVDKQAIHPSTIKDREKLAELYKQIGTIKEGIAQEGTELQERLAERAGVWKQFEPYFETYVKALAFPTDDIFAIDKDSKTYLQDVKTSLASMQKIKKNNDAVLDSFYKDYKPYFEKQIRIAEWKKGLYQSYFGKDAPVKNVWKKIYA